MSERWRIRSTPRTQIAKDQLVAVADRQWGLITRDQLGQLGMGNAGVSRWIAQRRLHRINPAVYSVGHRSLGIEGKFAAALLYAGPGAMLSHLTAAWWMQLVPHRPRLLQVSSPRRRASLTDVRVYGRRGKRRVWYRNFPITPPAQVLLDIANGVSFGQLHKAVAEAEYQRLVRLSEVKRVLGHGKPGSAALSKALEQHQPRLARTKSELEVLFILLCEKYSVPLPDVNVKVAGFVVDGVWHDQRVVVELDGLAAHRHRLHKDHARDLALRRAGYVVLRYTWQQITEQPELVAADLLSHL